MRNTHFQQVRDSWKTHSTFFLGKNRVMALALGRTENEEYSDKVSTFTIRYTLSKTERNNIPKKCEGICIGSNYYQIR